MSTLSDINLGMILHRIRVKLYPSYLNNVEGAYIARTNNQKTLDIDDVCLAMKTRGNFLGNYKVLREYIDEYIDEVAYQLCDGYAVTNGYFTVYPNIGGSFNSANEVHDSKKHPIDFRFSIRTKLRDLIKRIRVEVEGIADCPAYIDKFLDQEEESLNNIFIPGNMFTIRGHRIKLAGEGDEIGVFFIPDDDPSKTVKVLRIGENTPSMITGIAPDTGFTHNKIQICTYFSGTANKPLKNPRTITSAFSLELANR